MISRRSQSAVLASLLSATLAVAGCSSLSARDPQQKRATAAILEAYAKAMMSGEYGNVPFASDVTFVGPLTSGPIVGIIAGRRGYSS